MNRNLKWEWTISCGDQHNIIIPRARTVSVFFCKQQQQQEQISLKIWIGRATGKIIEMHDEMRKTNNNNNGTIFQRKSNGNKTRRDEEKKSKLMKMNRHLVCVYVWLFADWTLEWEMNDEFYYHLMASNQWMVWILLEARYVQRVHCSIGTLSEAIASQFVSSRACVFSSILFCLCLFNLSSIASHSDIFFLMTKEIQ